MSRIIDRPGAVRAGESLELGALTSWLREQGVEGLRGEPELQQFPAGASNLTYLLRWPERELVLRRPPMGSIARSAHDMGREVRVLRALGPVYPVVPTVVAHCRDPEVLGAEFYLMDRIRGIVLRKEIPPELGLAAPDTRRLCLSVLEQLAALHELDVEAQGLQHLGRGAGYARRQIEGWTRRWRAALTPDAADFEPVIAWLATHTPQEVGITVVHNDFRFDNVLLDPSDPMRVVGVLDWEMCTLGDPLMDLGNSLAYWVEPGDDDIFRAMRRQPTHAPGMLSRAEVLQWYGERTGRDLKDFRFYEVYGLFRLAVILQQIFLRYHRGQTQDDRFASFGQLAGYLAARCQRVIER